MRLRIRAAHAPPCCSLRSEYYHRVRLLGWCVWACAASNGAAITHTYSSSCLPGQAIFSIRRACMYWQIMQTSIHTRTRVDLSTIVWVKPGSIPGLQDLQYLFLNWMLYFLKCLSFAICRNFQSLHANWWLNFLHNGISALYIQPFNHSLIPCYMIWLMYS